MAPALIIGLICGVKAVCFKQIHPSPNKWEGMTLVKGE